MSSKKPSQATLSKFLDNIKKNDHKLSKKNNEFMITVDPLSKDKMKKESPIAINQVRNDMEFWSSLAEERKKR